MRAPRLVKGVGVVLGSIFVCPALSPPQLETLAGLLSRWTGTIPELLETAPRPGSHPVTDDDIDLLTMCATRRALTDPARQLLRDRHHLTDAEVAAFEALLPTWSFLGLAHSLAALIDTARALEAS